MTKLPPHLISAAISLKRCSVCGQPFSTDEPDMESAFAEHIRKAHEPGQASEDANQVAARIVRESMKD